MFGFIRFLKNNFFLQNFASWVFSKVSPFVEHNIGKYSALRKAFYITALERLEGDYLEFGVFTGSSFIFSCRFGKKMQPLHGSKTRYFGFDSFEGFGEASTHDQHPFYTDDTFRVNANRVIKNIKAKTKGTETTLIKGFYNQTLKGHNSSELGITKARIIFIDCDLKDPAQEVLEYVKPIIQKGTVLIMDDFFSYKGDSTLGITGAFEEFNARNPHLKWRQVLNYGYGGVAFICSQCDLNLSDSVNRITNGNSKTIQY